MLSQAISIHVDRPRAKRLELTHSYDRALAEVTERTASVFGGTFLGVHCGEAHQFMGFVPLAHLRDEQGRRIMPADPADWLYEPNGTPIPNAMRRWVRGIVVDASGRRADDHAFFAVTDDAYGAVTERISAWRRDPPRYHTIANNCVKFALSILATAGIELPTAGLPPSVARLRRPEDVSEAIAKLEPRAGVRRVVRAGLLLGR